MMKKLSQRLVIISLLFCFNLKGISQTPAQRQIARPKGTTPAPFGFYEYLPSDYASNPTKSFPLLIFLHGTGEMGNGSANDLKKLINSGGVPGLVNRGKDFPFIMISPQTNVVFYAITPTLNQLLNYVKATYRVDASRIYLTGLSMGGAGTWFFAQDYPDKFAAIVPICGGGSPAAACNIKDIPTWAFHNSGDPRVGVHHTNWMINAIRACGGNPSVTIYQSNAHDAWSATYANQNMWNWLLSKRKGTAAPPANVLPVVNAGFDKGTTLPYNALNIGSVASDADGMISSYTWTKVNGPNATMGGVNTSVLNLSNLVAGTYTFRITVKDNSNDSAFDDVTVFVHPAANIPPVVNLGTDKGTTLPYNALNIAAVASDPDGTIASYSWTKVSGPGATMGGVNTSILNLSNLVAGTYNFRATVKDNKNATAFDEIQVFVHPAANIPPVVNLGTDKGTTLPYNALNIGAVASDPDGNIASYVWTKVSGPSATMGGVNTSILNLSNLVAGTYNFRVTVKDNKNAMAFDEIQVFVHPAANIPPVVNLGTDKGTTLPYDALNIAAVASDPDGTIASYAWTKISGPSATMGGVNTRGLNLSNLVAGTYTFRVTVKDNRNATAFDEIQLFVYPAPNVPPVVNLGTDKGTTLPYNTLNIGADASDPDGTISSYAWTKVSGPSANMGGVNSSILNLSNLVAGTYTFRITVKDNKNATAFDEIRLFVYPQNSNSSSGQRISSESLESSIPDSPINLFPNPTAGHFELDFGKELDSNVQIQISDIAGRQVFMTKEIRAGEFEGRPLIDVSFIPQGVYLVKVKIGYQEKTIRLVKF